jgi:hypothetical protein
MTGRLPPGFAELEPFVEMWALETEPERIRRRISSTMDDIRAFYDAVLPRAEAAAAWLRDLEADRLPDEPPKRLLELMLSLAEIAPCVENFGAPRVVDGLDVLRLDIIHSRLGR